MQVETYMDNRVIHLIFPTTEDACRTMMRFQEHYESPHFAGKVFTIGQMREWYTEQFGSFSYYYDWKGFNIPGSALQAFRNGTFDPLTYEEEQVVELFVSRPRLPEFYVIASADGDHETLAHEMTHAMFHLEEEYQDEVTKIIRKNESKLTALKKWMLKEGYSETVFVDEANAYLATDHKYLKEKGVKAPPDLVKKLNKLRLKFL